jgi:phosphate transport system permease protein
MMETSIAIERRKTQTAIPGVLPGVDPRPKRKLAGVRRTPWTHKLGDASIRVLSAAAIGAIVLVFVFIAREALPMFWESSFLAEVNLRDLFLAKQWNGYDEAVWVWQPVGGTPKYAILPLFVGSLKVTLLAMAISVPLGVGSAIFVAHYAPRRVREIVKPALELLAGVPSVVLGFFALMVIASVAQSVFDFDFRLNAVVAAIGLSLTIVPVIFTISEDALQAVPKSLTEAALALGARRHHVALRVVLPAATPGIAAACILGFGRAIGETMIVLMASGNAALVEPFDFTTSVRTVTASIAAELGEVAHGDPHWRILFLLGVMLFAVTFALNFLGGAAVRRLQRKLSGSQ